MASTTSCCLNPPPISPKSRLMQNIKKMLRMHTQTPEFPCLNLPPIVNALGVSRQNASVSLKICESLIVLASFFTPINSTNVYYLYFFQEQGRRNDLLSKRDGPVPQDDRHIINSTKRIRSLLSTPGFSINIKSDSVHCDPLSCVVSRSRCHTADYLKETTDVVGSVPGLFPSLLKPHSISTNIKSDRVHCGPLSCMASGPDATLLII